jgi:hypothetical protein
MRLFHSLLSFLGMWRWRAGEMELFCLGAKCSQEGVSLKEDSVLGFFIGLIEVIIVFEDYFHYSVLDTIDMNLRLKHYF